MLPAKFIWKPLVQKIVTGQWSRFHMRHIQPALPYNLKRTGLYLHVPFCKNLCSFCPYNRIEYDETLFQEYERAIHAEIELTRQSLNHCEFVSLYVGGGTPTVNLNGLLRILDHLKSAFSLSCDICIELHPSNMDMECLQSLKSLGVTMLSVGVESTSDNMLNNIGRNHDGKTAVDALRRAVEIGFDSVNADLMFALPGQTLKDWENDLRTVIAEGVDQISTYPLFSFPYSDLGQSQRIRQVKRPDSRVIRSMLDLTQAYAKQSGYDRCAVWSWLKPAKKKFSSITRHHYVGFGPSAASMTGTDFYVNTFDVRAYAASLPEKRPIVLSMPVDRRLEMAYWLYWRVYELKILDNDFQDLFGNAFTLDSVFSNVLKPFEMAGMIEKKNGGYYVTEPGAYWIHRLQNEYSLNYINRLWGSCRREAWPEEVFL
ncbi:MAG: radical SAM protein [Thermodesulfovibrionales bacterium]|jgi:oxygen-independent coproporphyrinogen-3 oxidase